MDIANAEGHRPSPTIWAYDQNGAKSQVWGMLQRAGVAPNIAAIAKAVAARIASGAVTAGRLEVALRSVLGALDGK